MDIQRTAEGGRITFRTTVLGRAVEAQSEYDPTTERWPVHVTVTQLRGRIEEIAVLRGCEGPHLGVLESGLGIGVRHVLHEVD
ncbi:hypothetical protein [Burkholderia stagnalis]|uniref:hypothetical protein n=1 Tax=Burkholderia stagnalis TaxID=1503054 RepID=UPI0012D89AC6|nr:hypothetical protein [Burkholderia stagnalis]